MKYADEDRCEQFGLDARRVESVSRRIEKAMTEAREMGLCLFGGSGSGSLRIDRDHGTRGEVAQLGPTGYDGGDGGDE